MSTKLKDILFCTYDTLSLKEKMVMPFFLVNLFVFFTINIVYLFLGNNPFIVESGIIIISILLSKIIVSKIRHILVLSIPSLVLVTYSYLDLLDIFKFYSFTSNSWVYFQLLALIYVNLLGSTRCNFVITFLILLTPFLSVFSKLTTLEIINMQIIVYYVFPIMLYISYLNTKLNIYRLKNLQQENQQNEKILLDKNAELENQKMFELGKMSSVIVHEINNPLTVILMILSRLQKKFELSENILEQIIKIEKQAKRISLITSLVKKKNVNNCQRKNLNLSLFLQEEVDLYSYITREKGIELESIIQDDVFLFINERELSQVIGNILSNAIDALNSVNKINKKIIVSLETDGLKALVKISDNANGVEPDKIEYIFKNGFTTKTRGKGVGLGLMLVKKLVDHNHGTIGFTTSCNGTTFEFRFNLALNTL